MRFSDLGLIKPLLHAVNKNGYDKPSPIQQQTIPVVHSGEDLMASAQTGTGKTAAFVLPILQQLNDSGRARPGHVRALVLTPTRELAAQVNTSVETYGKFLSLTSTVVFGGVNINPQIRKLKKGVDVLVATPGRLLDLYQQKAVKFDDVQVFVLDEADRMLDMGFINDMKRIQTLLPRRKQTLMFSATFSAEIRSLAKTMLVDPVEIDVAPRNTTVETVKQRIHPVDKKQKTRLLAHLIGGNGWSQVLVFSKTKHGANKLVRELSKSDIRACAIHGNKSQAQRTKSLADFKRGKVDVLVATDIAARGLDIVDLPHVINYDLPHVAEDYVHRIGRTGRAGKSGEAISLVSADEIKQLRDIERLTKQVLERIEIEDYEPEHQLPESSKPKQRQSSSKSGKRPSRRKSRSGQIASFDRKPRRPRRRRNNPNRRKGPERTAA